MRIEIEAYQLLMIKYGQTQQAQNTSSAEHATKFLKFLNEFQKEKHECLTQNIDSYTRFENRKKNDLREELPRTRAYL